MTVVIDRSRPVTSQTTGQGAGTAPVSAAAKARAKGDAGQKLYKPRTPIYPKLAHGRWRTIKWALLIATLTVYYVTPWIRWKRPDGLPQQAVLVDFDHARFYFFWIELWPQEVYFITGLLVIAALALFLVTAMFGRLWCGYACPQTVWTDLYIHVERLFEGDRNARMRLDAQPWSFDKAWRKIGKHLVWLGIGFGTGGAWIFYFHDAPNLITHFWIGQAPMTAYVSCALLTLTTYAFAGTMREQVCTYMCPWPRIQGAMLDEHSLQVTYRRDRGEPRGAHKKAESWEGRGDCVDCNQCVVVCPMGIDIRNGAQLECINCALCIDACDEIMARVERPAGLIAFDTDAAVAARACGKTPTYHLARPRTLYYAVALSVVSGIMLWGLLQRSPLVAEALRDRAPMFVRLHDGSIRDGYTLKIANRAYEPKDVQIRFAGVEGTRLKTPGDDTVGSVLSVHLNPDELQAVRVFVTAPQAALSAPNMPAAFTVSAGKTTVLAKTIFLSAQGNAP